MVAIAEELKIKPVQVLISWHVQRGVRSFSIALIMPHLLTVLFVQTVVLPKSVTPCRIEENLQGLYLRHYYPLNETNHFPSRSVQAPRRSIRKTRKGSNISSASPSRRPQQVVGH